MTAGVDKDTVRDLREAMRVSRDEQDKHLAKYRKVVRTFLGDEYPVADHTGLEDDQPLPLIATAVGIYTTALAGQRPHAIIESWVPGGDAQAASLELMVNAAMDDIRVGGEFQRAVTNALLAPFGVVRVGRRYTRSKRDRGGNGVHLTSLTASNIDPDDWFVDMTARRTDQAQWMGHRWSPSLLELKSNPLYDREEVGRLEEAYEKRSRDTGRSGDENDLASLHQGFPNFIEFRPRVKCLEIWVRDLGQVIVMPDLDMPDDIVLSSRRYTGRGICPYRILGFDDVPGGLMNRPPVGLWHHPAETINNLLAKLIDQANRQKSIGLVDPEGGEDAKRIMDAVDGEFYKVRNPNAAASVSLGGPNQVILAFVIQMRQLFSYVAGNLDLIGGLGTQSETLGQDRILMAQSSTRMKAMAERVADFYRDVITDLAWEIWRERVPTRSNLRRLPNTDLKWIETWPPPSGRRGRFEDQRFDIVPYSFQLQSPGERVAMVQSLITGIVIPMMGQLGLQIDANALMSFFATRLNLPELNRIVIHQDPDRAAAEVGAQGGEGEHRTYSRQPRPGMGQRGSDDAMTARLLGGALQPAEDRSMFQ